MLVHNYSVKIFAIPNSTLHSIRMTKLMEWLFIAFLVLGCWIAIITGEVHSSIGSQWYFKWMPVLLVLLFGIYASIVVLYRVLTFNNCESAAIELREEIREAIADLESKGIVLKKRTDNTLND